MPYTPINWQTGDTITAEKLNKMDNGWGFENTQLFSESVTTATVEGQPAPVGSLAYSKQITSDTLPVTFNGESYNLPLTVQEWGNIYGGFSESGPSFTTYPVCIVSNEGGHNSVYTETAGTYTISGSGPLIQTSEAFDSAVAHAENFAVVAGVTTFQEAVDAFKSGKHVYVTDDSQNNKTYRLPIILINESAYEIKFVGTTYNDTDVVLSGLSASSADGVLS